MSSSELLESFRNQGAVLDVDSSGATTVEHFGNVAAELKSAESGAVICPLFELIRIRATGKDRAKFLHSFCTNNVLAMQNGQVCEAFFTDVKARVVAHGMIVATADWHEIWMLPGDTEAVLNHLNRYIITEDVTFEAVSEQVGFAVIGPQTATVLMAAGYVGNVTTGQCLTSPEAIVVFGSWAGVSIAFVSVPLARAAATWQQLVAAGTAPAGSIVFEHVRIQERWPLVGIDITRDHMAPEADRSEKAISYTKGCYLGQEPIARLDAMGHVNRKLYRGIATRVAGAVPDADVAVATSVSRTTDDSFSVLIRLPVKSAKLSPHIPARLPDGTSIEVTLPGHGA